ncbi:amino acid aminotransferase [Pseudogemmobacter bohemicus]|uniref:amino acid aminotransferase n=1 Tax=Pseudogemmobacter bohemicus TaxID=2250708 RepID=UPI000DD344E6|nr:amino acid aminotransferase [Pseudogemmobacter bohemicus]
MLEALTQQPQDKILQLIAMFREDKRDGKIDLGVGVYKDPTGLTPVMRAVKAAEKKIWEAETTKTYTALAGEPAYNTAIVSLILGEGYGERAASVSTPGGTGALRQGFELVRLANPGAKVWLSAPTWPNHPSIVKFLGMAMAEYRYFDVKSSGLDFAGLIEDLGRVAEGDVVLLHGCCHNPTGANLSSAEWDEVIAVLKARKAVPLVDLAYQGFGDGLDADAEATRKVAAAFDEMLIAASCSKNFGIYRERTGVLIALTSPERKAVVQGNLNFLNRQNFSFPPDHGARIVTTILEDAALTADWKAELEEVRLNMLGLRVQLAEELRRATNSDRFDFVADHRGMFSRLGLSEAQVNRLREEFGVYMVGDSRINIAGLNKDTVPVLARAIASVL